jgi:hypothetical protein
MSKGTIGFVPNFTVKKDEVTSVPSPQQKNYVTVPSFWITMMLTIILVLAVVLLTQTARSQQA